ncbi:DUF1952 domain-containing protein [Promineifilum sp.]|uniref:DUF1952 domain-containing protein n=1 Tax=Promineifilum sp. TaxID=2664178 RepID=UPI0035AECD49
MDEVTEVHIHAIPLWLLREYLEELGGRAQSETEVAGDGWRAELLKLPDRHIGSLRIGLVQVTLTGEAAALARLRPNLDRKTMRAGA